jgi:hypothetical protein
MGLSYLVYPGANHTRFHHALGCMHLMKKAIDTLRFKEVQISDDEECALLIAILLHDIGHGPFSHAMEKSIVEDVHHEAISLLFMNQLNEEFDGRLSLAIQVFKGEYHRKFMLQLISSQLDMDRMDYLKRDSFYSGVAEGNINSDRLIQMMNVVDDVLVIEEKGIYFEEACEKILDEYDSSALTWAGFGNFDREQIFEQCDWLGIEIPFGGQYLNVMEEFREHFSLHKMTGLKRALEYLKMDFEGNHHSGADDAYNAAKILRKILE